MAGHFYQGQWITTTKTTQFHLNPQPFGQLKTFSIGLTSVFVESAGARSAKFRLIVDGVKLPLPFFEGGQVVVEAKQVAIEQINEGVIMGGAWEVIQEAQIPAIVSRWEVPTVIDEFVLLGSFKTEVEAVIQFYSAASPVPSNGERAYAKVFCDGNSLLANGEALLLPQGSSVVCRAKTFGLQIAVPHPNPKSVLLGELKLRAQLI